jgi:hypothetical protein
MARAAAGADHRRRQRVHHRLSRRPHQARDERTGRRLSRCRPARHQSAPDRQLARPLASNQHALEFASMVSRDDAFQLATLRAVDAAYPLRGEVRIADRPFEAGAAAPGAAAARRGLCRPGTADAVECRGRRCGADRRSHIQHRRRGGRGTRPAWRRVRLRPARLPARRRGRGHPRAAARQPAHLSLPVRRRAGAARGFRCRAETDARNHPAPDRLARRRRDPARRVCQRRPLPAAHRADQPLAVGGRHRHRRAPPRAAPLRPGRAAALHGRHHGAAAHALCGAAAHAGAAGQPRRGGDRRADAAGTGRTDPAGRRYPPAVAGCRAGRCRRRQRSAWRWRAPACPR